MDVTHLFPKFYPNCKKLLDKNHQGEFPQILKKLDDQIATSSSKELDIVCDHIMFPFSVYLSEPILSENYTISVINLLKRFYDRVPSRSKFFLFKTLEDLAGLVRMKEAHNNCASEDLRIAICQLISGLYRASTVDVLLEFYEGEKTKYLLSQVVSDVLRWMETDHHVFAVFDNCAKLLETFCDFRDCENLHRSFCKVFSQMLPGIATKLIKLIQNGVVGLKVKRLSLHIWTLYVTAIISDKTCWPFLEPNVSSDHVFYFEKDWFNLTRDHLSNHYKIIFNLCSSISSTDLSLNVNSICKLRAEILVTVRLLFSKSSMVFSNLFSDHIDILCFLSVDLDSIEGCKEGERLLNELIEFIRVQNGQNRLMTIDAVVAKAQEEIFKACEELEKPKMFNSERIFSNVTLLSGYIQLLKNVEGSSHFFSSKTYVRSLVRALLAILKLDHSPKQIEDDLQTCLSDFKYVTHPELVIDTKRPDKKFVFLNASHLLRRYWIILRLLAQLQNLDILATEIFALMKQQTIENSDEEIVLLLSDVLQALCEEMKCSPGIFEEEMGRYHCLLQSCVENFLQVDEKVIQSRNIGADNSTLAKINDINHLEEVRKGNTYWNLNSLIAEMLGRLALVAKWFLWPDYQDFYLGKSLSFVLTNLDSSNSNYEARIVYHALKDMKEGCIQRGSIEDMLREHLDYLTTDLNLKLMQSQYEKIHHKGLLNLLQLVLRMRALDDCSGLRETLKALLVHLDMSWMDPDREKTTDILKIILIFVQSLNSEIEPEKQDKKPRDCSEALISQFALDLKLSDDVCEEEDDDEKCPSEGFHRKDNDKNNDILDPEPGNNHVPPEDEENDEKVPSEKTQMLKDILEHTRHFVSMVKCPEWQIVALDIVSRATSLIKNDEDNLLPLVHLCWQPLKLLFTSDNLFLVDKLFQVLRTFSSCAKDFIRKRTLEDVFPAILKYVKRLQVIVQDEAKKQTLAARQARKMLQDMFTGLFEFMDLLNLDEIEVDVIMEELLDFAKFCEEQNKRRSLRNDCDISKEEVCLEFKPVRHSDRDALWLKTGSETVIIYC